MINNWKLFLESNSRDKEILDNIRDILISLKVDHSIRVYIRKEYDFDRIRVDFIIEGEIGLDEVQTISHLDSYLKSEEFITCSTEWENKLQSKVVVQRTSGKLTQYSISKLITMLNDLNKDVIDLTRIDFAYYIPDYLLESDIFKIGTSMKL